MSKSLGNYVGISEPPAEMFGKLMSISDELMWRYLDLLSFRSSSELAALRADVAGGANPRDVKVGLAKELVARFHGDSAAESAAADFVRRFRDGGMPEDIEEVCIHVAPAGVGIANLLREARLVSSNSEAFRMIDQGAVRIDGERLAGRDVRLPASGSFVIQVGKRRFRRVRLVPEGAPTS
jgi:tyrosyl-tRNA synthetase